MMRSALLLVCMGLSLITLAQDTTNYARPSPPKTRKDARPFADRIWFGGGVGLNFGSVTAIQLEPMVGYKVDQKGKFSLGTGITYWYFSDNRTRPRIEYNAYGYRLFARYRVIPQAYLHSEFLHMNAERYIGLKEGVQRIWVPHLLLGAGYVQPLGQRSSFVIQMLVEVLQDPNSVYRGMGPIFSGGVGFGF